MRLIALILSLLPSAFALSGGPDAGGMVYTDSSEPNGPSHRWLDTSGGKHWVMADDDTVDIALPFDFSFYGTTWSQVTVSSNGVVFFAGASTDPAGSCPAPSGASWTGVAAFWDDLEAGYVETDTFGTWPSRTFVVSWPAAVPQGATGVGRFQVWLLEGRDEAIVVLDDLTFGSAADGGATAVIGTGGASGATPYACSTTTANATTVWFGDEDARPARAVVGSDDLETPWIGSATYEQSGTGLEVADLDDDGYDDLLVGAKDDGAGHVWLISGPDTPDYFANATADFSGASALDAFGAGLGAGDLDGDGSDELGFGAPDADIGGASSGAVFLYTGGGWSGAVDSTAAYALVAGEAGLHNRVGEVVRLGVDLNGDGYGDLVIGAPHADDAGSDAGKLYVLYGAASLASGALSAGAADATFTGDGPADLFGTAISAADVDSDGTATDLLVGAPGATDAIGNNGGAVYMITEGAWAGANPVAGLPCAFYGSFNGGGFGTSVLGLDLDGTGLFDLVVGAPTADGVGADAGSFAVLYDMLPADCGSGSASFDVRIEGTAGSQQLGAALAAGDVDDDGSTDLLVSAPNYSSGSSSSGGAVGIWLGAPTATGTLAGASIRLQGDGSGGAFGQSIGLAASPGLRPEVVVAAPYTTTTYTRDGALFQYRNQDNFEDADADGFVTEDAGGNDCDDTSAEAYPGGTDVDGDSIDGDCDGWTDGVIEVRDDLEGWTWDLSAIGGSTWDAYDFESYTDGDRVTVYGNLTLGGEVYAETDVYGSAPQDSLGGQLIPGLANELTVTLDSPADAVSLRLLDPDATFTLVATDVHGDQVAGYTFTATSDDHAGGVFYGFVFVDSVTTLTLTADSNDGFGLDDLYVVDATSTDRDLDGFTDAEGDCDDADFDINPSAIEVLGDGLDNDCDGLIDSGPADLFADASTWSSAAAIDPQLIDFELLTEGETVQVQYESVGVSFDGELQAATDVDGSSPNGSLGALSTTGSTSIVFEEVQPSYSFVLLDADGTFTVDAYEDYDLLYSMVITGSGPQTFVGVVGTDYVDQIVITGPEGETWGLDDLTLNVLGRDDADNDGQTEPTDCDDEDASVFTGAPDTWYDGIDSDCADNDDFDQDGDGFALGADCEDTSSAVNPSVAEIYYDGFDQNCDGLSDFDADLDGHDSRDWSGDDCGDDDATIYVGAPDTWYDGVDSDCAGNDDFDQDGDGIPVSGGVGSLDCDDTDALVLPGGAEIPYNGIDDDCDANTSDVDLDSDGHLSEAIGGDDCQDDDPSVYLGAPGEACYDGIDTDCDHVDDFDCDEDGFISADYDGDDCDDADLAISPAAEETCYDGVDQNCDQVSDFDCDVDGYDGLAFGGADCDDLNGAYNPGAADFPYDGLDLNCDGGEEFDVDGDGATADWYGGTDCDDSLASVYPGAPDDCYDGIDADCAGDTDYDCDEDGFLSTDFGGDDCDDGDAAISPLGSEIPEDGIDQDCDGADLIVTDLDEDGFATPDDCDDSAADVYPGAPDAFYDGIDSDCNEDDDFDADLDGDDAEAWGGGDCNDADATVGTFNTTDACGNGDEDCDGSTDEDCATEDSAAESQPPDDTGSGNPDSGASRDTDWRPDPEAPTNAEKIPAADGCGCSTGDTSSAAGLGLGLLLLARRRR